MLLIKYISILSIFLFFGINTESVDQTAELKGATYVSTIVDHNFDAQLLDAFEDITKIDNVQLYERTDAYIYQIKGVDINGKQLTTYAIIPMANMGQFNPSITLACGCQRNGRYWSHNGLERVCENYCLEIDIRPTLTQD